MNWCISEMNILTGCLVITTFVLYFVHSNTIHLPTDWVMDDIKGFGAAVTSLNNAVKSRKSDDIKDALSEYLYYIKDLAEEGSSNEVRKKYSLVASDIQRIIPNIKRVGQDPLRCQILAILARSIEGLKELDGSFNIEADTDCVEVRVLLKAY